MSAKSVTVLLRKEGQVSEATVTAEPVGPNLTIHREIREGMAIGEEWTVTFSMSGLAILTDLPSRKAARAAANRLVPIVTALRAECEAINGETRAAKGW